VTLKESQNWLENEQRLSISIPTMDKFIRQKLGSRYKKTVAASEQQREDVASTRAQWQAWQKSCGFPDG
jgi:hypothetical protein